MSAATCGAPDVVRRAQPAGGGSGGSSGEFASSSSQATGGIVGGTSSALPTGGTGGQGGISEAGGGTGGTSSAGGTGAGGGTSTTGGRGGAGGTSATGGKGGTGGSIGPFGSDSAGGAAGTTDTSVGGTGASGGVGGSSDTTPVTPPPTDGLAVWAVEISAGGTGQIRLYLRIDNMTAKTVDISTVTLRYWYQDQGEGLGTTLTLATNYVQIGHTIAAKVTLDQAAAVSPPAAGADHYLQLSFSGTLAVQGDTNKNDQFTSDVRLYNSTYTGTINVANDYSYKSTPGYDDKITLHDKSGKPIWGKPPVAGSTGPTVDASVSGRDSGG